MKIKKFGVKSDEYFIYMDADCNIYLVDSEGNCVDGGHLAQVASRDGKIVLELSAAVDHPAIATQKSPSGPSGDRCYDLDYIEVTYG